jgi:hypothetical protein
MEREGNTGTHCHCRGLEGRWLHMGVRIKWWRPGAKSEPSKKEGCFGTRRKKGGTKKHKEWPNLDESQLKLLLKKPPPILPFVAEPWWTLSSSSTNKQYYC